MNHLLYYCFVFCFVCCMAMWKKPFLWRIVATIVFSFALYGLLLFLSPLVIEPENPLSRYINEYPVYYKYIGEPVQREPK